MSGPKAAQARPSAHAWRALPWMFLILGFGFAAVSAAIERTSNAVLTASGTVLLVLLALVGRKMRRGLILHGVLAAFVIYQVTILDMNRQTPNIGVIWFAVIPMWAASLGRRHHVKIWGPIAVLAVLFTWWRALPSDPLWQHPLMLANMVALVITVALPAVFSESQRRAREIELEQAAARARTLADARGVAEQRAAIATARAAQLLATLSHDLRTPMNALVLAVEVASTGAAEDRSRARGWIRESSEQLTRSVDQMLDLARIEAGQWSRELKPLSCLEWVRTLVDEHGVRAVVAPDMVAKGLVDARLLSSTLHALIRTLQHNLREEALHLHVQAGEQEASWRLVLRGPGIERRRGEFERLRVIRQPGVPSEPSVGVGLDLVAMEAYAQALQATVELRDDDPGTPEVEVVVPVKPVPGTTVGDEALPQDCKTQQGLSVGSSPALPEAAPPDSPASPSPVLPEAAPPDSPESPSPVLPEAAPPDSPAPAALAPAAPAASPEGAQRVLVVDDDDLVRTLLVRLLKRSGYQVGQANGGEAALRSFEAEPAALVLLDLGMPGMSGPTTLARLRALGGVGAAAAVIVLSGRAPSDEERAALDADAFLMKPVSRADLHQQCVAVLEQTAQRRARAAGDPTE